MREILFRGKRITGHRDGTPDGTMLYGCLFIDKKGQPKIKWYNEQYGISVTSNVDPNTVGQYTGLTDKNGRKIFEGDIIQVTWSVKGRPPVHETHTVVYSQSGFFAETKGKLRVQLPHYTFIGLSVEVIGNIHDNPELLGVNDDA